MGIVDAPGCVVESCNGKDGVVVADDALVTVSVLVLPAFGFGGSFASVDPLLSLLLLVLSAS